MSAELTPAPIEADEVVVYRDATDYARALARQYLENAREPSRTFVCGGVKYTFQSFAVSRIDAGHRTIELSYYADKVEIENAS